MSGRASIRKPTKRECEVCGRREEWRGSDQSWMIASDGRGTDPVGDPHCIHEWDINGNFLPYE